MLLKYIEHYLYVVSLKNSYYNKMERTSKITKTKEIRKVRSKNTRKTCEKQLMVQLHHFANLSKSTTATKAATLNLTGDSKALLENDYFKIINSKQHKNKEFTAKPFVINKIPGTDADFCDKIRCSASLNNKKKITHTNKEIKDLVLKKFKAKDKVPKNPFAIACRDVNSMISIKDYHRVFGKKIFENRLVINGILIYDTLKHHYSGIPVARNCFKKKFINNLNQATKGMFPEMEQFKTTNNNKENRLLQKVIDYYEIQDNDVKLFNEQMIHVPNNDNNNNNDNKNNDNVELFFNDNDGDELILECDENIEDRPITPEIDYFSPESYQTPPSQRLIPVDLAASTVSKYQTVFYEKDAKSGKASLFEIPQSFKVTGTNANINRSVLKRIDLSEDNIVASCSKPKSRVESARLLASGKLQMNDLTMLGEPGASPTSKKPKKCPKKRLFHHYTDDTLDGFEPLEYHNSDENLFVRPLYSPKEFTEIKKKYSSFRSPRKCGNKQKKTLKVDELDFCVQHNDTLKNIAKIKTPEHRYFPFVQFDRK